jgi:hypothetical protein
VVQSTPLWCALLPIHFHSPFSSQGTLLSRFFCLCKLFLFILDLLTALCFDSGALNLLLLPISLPFRFQPFLLLLSGSMLCYTCYSPLLFLPLFLCAMNRCYDVPNVCVGKTFPFHRNFLNRVGRIDGLNVPSSKPLDDLYSRSIHAKMLSETGELGGDMAGKTPISSRYSREMIGVNPSPSLFIDLSLLDNIEWELLVFGLRDRIDFGFRELLLVVGSTSLNSTACPFFSIV